MQAQDDNAPSILVAQADGVATITLNRPARRNALNRDMCIQLRAAVQALDADPEVRVVLVRAAGPVFCAGADLTERRGMNEDQVRARRLLAFAAYDMLESMAKPCVAVVEGPAIGSGAEIAAACDFIVATEAASFRYPEVGWGTIGATQRLPELIGRRNAKDLLLTGREVDANEALALGLASRVVPAGELQETVAALAATIAAAPPGVVASTKRCVDERAVAGRRAALATEMLSIEALLSGSSWRERIDTFGKN